MFAIDGATAKPTESQMKRVVLLEEETEAAKAAFEQVMRGEIAELNQRLKEMPQLMVGPWKP